MEQKMAEKGTYPPHVERMLTEGEELAPRLAKLQEFISEANPTFMSLGEDDRHLLTAQFCAMTNYAHILEIRINRATGAYQKAE